MKNNAKLFFILLVTVLLVAGCGTGAQTAEPLPDGAFRVYMLDHDRTSVVAEAYTVRADRSDVPAVVDEVALALQSAPREKDHLAPVTEDVVLREYHMEDCLLTLDFDVRYLDLDPATEALTRAAIVLSFTQIDGVDGVLFLVSGTALMKDEAAPVGVMTADSFLISVLP